jgi:hypothetical protein
MIPNEQMASRPTPSVQKSMPTMYSWRESSLHHAHLYIYISTHNVYIYSLYIYWNNFHFVHHSKQSKLTPPPSSGRTSIFIEEKSPQPLATPHHIAVARWQQALLWRGEGVSVGNDKVFQAIIQNKTPPSKTVLK